MTLRLGAIFLSLTTQRLYTHNFFITYLHKLNENKKLRNILLHSYSICLLFFLSRNSIENYKKMFHLICISTCSYLIHSHLNQCNVNLMFDSYIEALVSE